MKNFDVVLNLLGEDILVGQLGAANERKLVVSFQYNPAFLAGENFFNISPELYEVPTIQYPHPKVLFGFMEDSMPNRWGKALIKRKLGRPIDDLDALLEIDDFARMGALRFYGKTGPLSQSSNIPTLKNIRELQNLVSKADDLTADLTELFDPGSPLGGARPKAGIMDQGLLKIAKFPKNDDNYNVEAWEKTMLDLASQLDINVPKAEVMYTPLSKYAVLILERFDRKDGQRQPYLSAMSALQASDNDGAGSYIEIIDFISQFGEIEDANELWKRMVFGMLVNNYDDHLRNHGFLRKGERWRLSPAFDINPSTDTNHHQLSIDGSSHDPDISLAIELSGHFYLSAEAADDWLSRAVTLLSTQLEPIAKQNKIAAAEITAISKQLNYQHLGGAA
ncbi:MAG: type II toxin-antitoxin system HipA family toxin [Methylophagaceae bacterium]